MRNSTTIMATIALGAVLAIGSASASMARGPGGGSGHMGSGGFGGDHGGNATPFFMNQGGGFGGGGGFSGSRSFGGHPSVMSNGGNRGMGMRLGGDRGFDGGHHDGFRRHHDHDNFGAFGFGAFLPDQYGACAYDPAERAYLWQHGVRYYCP